MGEQYSNTNIHSQRADKEEEWTECRKGATNKDNSSRE
jgi:hypothetical protein